MLLRRDDTYLRGIREMTGEVRPFAEGLPGSLHRPIDIRGGTLGHGGEEFAGGGIHRSYGFVSATGRPNALDEMVETALVGLQPFLGLLGALRGGTVLHGLEDFGYVRHGRSGEGVAVTGRVPSGNLVFQLSLDVGQK